MARVGFTLRRLINTLKSMEDLNLNLGEQNVTVINSKGEEFEIEFVDGLGDNLKIKLNDERKYS